MSFLSTKLGPVGHVRHYINGRLCKTEPIYIIAATASGVIAGVWIWNLIFQPESLSSRIKKTLFKLVRKIPSVSRKIDDELKKVNSKFHQDAIERSSSSPYLIQLPSKGLSIENVIKEVNNYLNQGEYDWKGGYVSGAVYNYNDELVDLLTKVYGIASYTNPLHSDIFPGVVKMEAEIVKMTANLFHGGPDTCGTMTSGGTESILMACKAYRDYGRDVCGIKQPEMVIPRTAHPAFEKASIYFGITIKYVPVDPVTYTVPVKRVKSLINSNTIMIVGSAPNFPYGTMDDIEALAAVAKSANVPLHVDCCLGGFIAPFMKLAGFSFPQFDFLLDGVTSISADTHKYGFAPKGSSVILYSHPKFRQYQYCVTTDWPGGVYGSPSVNGSRAGGIIAACWATLIYHGLNGYIESTKKIVETTFYITNELKKIDTIYVFGKPATSVIAIGSTEFQIFRLGEKLRNKGWNLNPLQFPSGIHLCVTYMHTMPGVADTFINTVRECISEIMVCPEKPVEGEMAIYGMSQTIPDRSVVGEFTKLFIDSMYLTPSREDFSKALNGHSL